MNCWAGEAGTTGEGEDQRAWGRKEAVGYRKGLMWFAARDRRQRPIIVDVTASFFYLTPSLKSSVGCHVGSSNPTQSSHKLSRTIWCLIRQPHFVFSHGRCSTMCVAKACGIISVNLASRLDPMGQSELGSDRKKPPKRIYTPVEHRRWVDWNYFNPTKDV